MITTALKMTQNVINISININEYAIEAAYFDFFFKRGRKDTEI